MTSDPFKLVSEQRYRELRDEARRERLVRTGEGRVASPRVPRAVQPIVAAIATVAAIAGVRRTPAPVPIGPESVPGRASWWGSAGRGATAAERPMQVAGGTAGAPGASRGDAPADARGTAPFVHRQRVSGIAIRPPVRSDPARR